jgi:uncharacterized protein (TIGR02466 family)
MTKPIITNLFPTPIYRCKINRKLNKQELFFIDKTKSECYANEGNVTSKDNYILNNKEFKILKKEIDVRIQDYFDKIISPSNDITPFITQSWINFTKTNQFHHKHTHPNSIISGVFYINCDEKFDKIKFFKEEYSIIKLEIKDWNIWNSQSWWFPLSTGDLIIFPSSLAHMVETKQGTNTRISLAFNVFIKGLIGSNSNLSELKL